MGSNKDRFVDAIILLQRALFDWYLQPPAKFEGVLSRITREIERWSNLKKEEQRTLSERRFALNSETPDIPAVESGVSASQWQRIFGSLGLGFHDPGTFDRFLVQLDVETNPSLRVNHRYMGELLPHDNMISYFSSTVATFLNENAIIGRVSPCVTHMEEAAARWLMTLVGWDGAFRLDDDGTERNVPLQRLPTIWSPNFRYDRWQRDEPVATIVAGGTIANLSAILMARNAVFDYLLGWDGAVQALGPSLAWECVSEIWKYKRMIIVTSPAAHYSVEKAALNAGIPPVNVIKVRGSDNPWVFDGSALHAEFDDARAGKEPQHLDRDTTKHITQGDLVIAVVPIAGTTEHGYVDRIAEIAEALDYYAEEAEKAPAGPPPVGALPPFKSVVARMLDSETSLNILWANHIKGRAPGLECGALAEFRGRLRSLRTETHRLKKDLERMKERTASPIRGARHNRLFLHVDAAHGGGYLTVPHLRYGPFEHIELADTVTIDGHKSLYCYYPCGGLLIRTTRWARTLKAGSSKYINEESHDLAYPECMAFHNSLSAKPDNATPTDWDAVRDPGDVLPSWVTVDRADRDRLAALQGLIGRSLGSKHSELEHHPYERYLEGSRGPQGIMQIYFNAATLGIAGYRSILEWTYLLRKRCQQAISIGMSDLLLVTDEPLAEEPPAGDIDSVPGEKAPELTFKQVAIATANTVADANKVTLVPVTGTMPIAGGRLLVLSDGELNQLLVTFVPAMEAKLIVTAPKSYWTNKQVCDLLHLLWRVNEHLWHELYPNPSFSYYVGHTHVDLALPRGDMTGERLARLLQRWNIWTRMPGKPESTGYFFTALGAMTKAYEEHEGKRHAARRESLQATAVNADSEKSVHGSRAHKATEPSSDTPLPAPERPKFFCHKIILTHPYTDETLISDMLRRLVFWGARSRDAVLAADQAWNLLEPTICLQGKKKT